jgi:hypothetical protein
MYIAKAERAKYIRLDTRPTILDDHKPMTGLEIARRIGTCFRVLSSPIEWILWLRMVLRLDLWMLSGDEVSSGHNLTILYAGNKDYPENRHLIIKLAFDTAYRERHLGKAWVWNMRRVESKRNPECALMIAEVPRLFRLFLEDKKSFYIPTWFDGEVGISAPSQSDSFKTDIRRIKKRNLSFEITNERRIFQDFYYHMHVPYISKTFGLRAFIHGYEHISKNFHSRGLYNNLLLIHKGSEPIAGILLGYVDDTVYLHYVGIKDGNYDYVRDGALGALFYFPIIHAKEKGYRGVNFGLTRSFLKDGVLQFKKKRGMKIANDYKIGFVIQAVKKSAGVQGFFLNNPFIHLHKGKFAGAIFLTTEQSLSPEDIKKIYKEYHLKGMSELAIYRFGLVECAIRDGVPPALADQIRVLSADCLF